METIYIPVSLGELIDKLSILHVKEGRIKDEEKLKNIRKEKALLTEIAEKINIDHHYWYDLVNINEQIWSKEDWIRIKYKKEEYDDTFIKLAQTVHELNDKRGQIKREINLKYGSDIIEEKYHKEE